MNKTKSLFLVLGLACFTSFFITCKNPTENIVVTVKADYVTAASLFNVADAATGEWDPALEGTAVKITGPAAAIVYNSGGSHNIKMTSGVFSISFAKGTTASKDNPLKFNIEISANGYQPIVYPVTLTSVTPTTETIYLINTSNLPKGSAKVTGTATIDNTNLTTDITTIEVPTNTDKKEKATITIPKGIKMFDADGNALTGTVNIEVIHISPTTEEADNAIGDNVAKTITDKNGNTLPQTGLATAGSLKIEMTVGGKTVKSFDKPITARIEFDNEIFNPLTANNFKENDAISVLSQNNGSGIWVKENSIVIAKDANGKLYGDFEITHLSTWVAANTIIPYNLLEDLNLSQLDANKHYEVAGGVTYSQTKNGRTTYRNILGSAFKVEKGVLYLNTTEMDLVSNFTITAVYLYIIELTSIELPNSTPTLDYLEVKLQEPLPPITTPIQPITPIMLQVTPIKVNITNIVVTKRTGTTIYAFGKCNNGKKILSPNGQIVKYMKLSDYTSTTAFSSSAWTTKSIDYTTGSDHNTLFLYNDEFAAGTTYKIATEYDNLIRYKDYTLPVGYKTGTATSPLEISLGNSCP